MVTVTTRITKQTRRFAYFASLLAIFSMIGFSPASAQTDAEKHALAMYRRVAGVRISLDDPKISQMASLISQGQFENAAAIPTADVNFYGITVKEFAAKMSNRELTVSAPLTDFVATVIGITRDGVDAREMLTGDFYYAGDSGQINNLPMDEVDDFLKSNAHYEAVEASNQELVDVLVRVDGQKLVGADAQSAIPHRDPAGVITSRSFMAAHAIDGTNRRLVEYSMKSFACMEITEWADTSVADVFVGRDVDRFPEGSNNRFQATCKGCHASMDSMRPAFAMVDFDTEYLKYAGVQNGVNIELRNDPDNDVVDEDEIAVDSQGVPFKFTRATDTFPEGYIVASNEWTNLATTRKHEKLFGWRSATSGVGMGDFGKMVSESKGFSACMVKRAFESVCKRGFNSDEDALKELLTTKFEQDYDFKNLFISVAARPECLGM